MDKYYFFLVKPEIVGNQLGQHICILQHPMFSNVRTEVGVLFIDLTGEGIILPYVYKIINKKTSPVTITLEIVQEYEHGVSIQQFFSTLSEKTSSLPGNKLPDIFTNPGAFSNSLKVSSLRFVDIPGSIEICISLMGGIKDLTEQRMIAAISEYIKARGYYFPYETLANYHICLKTRPFVILAGLSGTGKSKLSQLYGEALGGNDDSYLRLPVRPNWNDDRYLIGYFNTLNNEYFTERAIEFVLEANKHPEKLYLFCLDEMNLAHVEHYFSQFLSALEEDRIEKRRITLMGKNLYQRYITQQQKREQDTSIPEEVILPANLLFTGTINVDETTQPISDKVIDRANTIEFFKIEIGNIPPSMQEKEPLHISAAEWRQYCVTQPDTSYRKRIEQIEEILNRVDIGFGYRVIREIELYLANSDGLLERNVAFDLQVKQRILPRVRGTEVIKDMLDELGAFLTQQRLPRSLERVEDMQKRLERDGYTSFWR